MSRPVVAARANLDEMDHRHATVLVLALVPLASALRPTQQYVGARPTQQQMRRETALSSTNAGGGARLEPRVPTDSDDMVIAAARSVRTALEAGVARQTVELHIPLPPETSPEDLDPWPGGLPQIAEYALPLARECLRKAVKGGSEVQEVVLSKDDGCVQLYCQGETPSDDAMMLLQPGAETFDELRQLDGAVGDRLLVLVNPKIVGPQSLGLFQGAVSKDFFKGGSLRDKFPVTYCAQESSCRSEDVRLVHEYGKGWRAYYVDDAEFEGQNMISEGTILPLHDDPLDARPSYEELQDLVIEKLKLPVYVRKMREAGEKGPRFLR